MLVHCCFMFAFAGLDCFPLNNHSHKTNKQTNKEQKKKKTAMDMYKFRTSTANSTTGN